MNDIMHLVLIITWANFVMNPLGVLRERVDDNKITDFFFKGEGCCDSWSSQFTNSGFYILCYLYIAVRVMKEALWIQAIKENKANGEPHLVPL